LPCGAGGFCFAERVTTAGGAGDLPCGAGKGGNGRRSGRFALRRGRLGPAARARAALACDAGGLPGGVVTTAGVAGDLPCGAGKGGNGQRRGRFAWRHGRFALRRGQGWQRPATLAIRLAARASRAGSAVKGGIGLRRGRFAWRRG